MMEGRPVKFRLLEIFAEKGHLWNYEITDIMANEYKDRKSKYGQQATNWDLIELAASGFIKETDASIDENKRNGNLLIEYGLTSIGRGELERLKNTISPRGE
jgi:V8-like Glu-specific endopeptidase